MKVFALISILSLQAYAAETCHSVFAPKTPLVSKSHWYERRSEDAKGDFFNPLSYLNEKNRADTWGRIDSKFREDLETRIWFGATGTANAKGEVPLVDPNAKAVFIFFHGSGTMQSSGKNFFGIMNNLANMGFASVSFDMPFHAEGPIRDQFRNSKFFMDWIDKIVSEAKRSGKPVYLVGHSFGPDVIAEYVTQKPFAVDGALLISPAGFNQTLREWYDTHTSKMKFGGDVPENSTAGAWAAEVSSQFIWNKNKAKDPSLVNPALKLQLLTGNREEYVPAPTGGSNKTPIGPNTYDLVEAFKKHISRVDAVVEDGIGHYIFNHTDKNGSNVVMREILRLGGYDIRKAKALLDEQGAALNTAPPAEKMAFKYAFDRNFQSWADAKVGKPVMLNIAHKRKSDYEAGVILERYETERKAYEQTLLQAILQNEAVLSQFMATNKSLVEQTKKDAKKNGGSLLTAFARYLNSLPEVQREALMQEIRFGPGEARN